MTREEAINKVRQMSLPKETMDILEALVPELCESEDERIRKGLIEALKASKTVGELKFVLPYPTREECIAYLEKQKEQKPAEGKEYTSPDCGTSACCDDECFEIIAQAKSDIIEKTNIAENALSMELPLLDGILMRVWQVGWLNKKPAEWSKNDAAFLNEITDLLESKTVIFQHDLDMYVHWLKSLPERFVLQPKQEWSEEDADMLNCCISSIEEAKENRYAYKETDGDTSYDREIDWLKSLRPSWKPSDEQLRPLEYAIDYFKKKRNDTTYLESLYNDLKKLM